MITTIFACLLATVPFLLSVFLCWKVNFREERRHLQLLLPFVSVIYGLLSLQFLNQMDADFVDSGLLASAYMPLFSGMEGVGFAAIFSFAFILGFVVIKLAYKLLMLVLAIPYEFLLRFAFGWFYEYDDECEHWCLHKEYEGARKLLKSAFLAVCAISVVLFCLSGIEALSVYFANSFHPAFAVLILEEILGFMSGVTKQEVQAEIRVEDDQATRVFQYAKVKDALEHYFGDRILHSFSRGQRHKSVSSHQDYCEELVASPKQTERVAGAYFDALVKKGLIGQGSPGGYEELSHDEAANAVRLLEGKSVMYASPFYEDYVPYVFFPLNARLMRNGKGLVLYGSECSADQVCQYVSEGLAFVTNIERMWDVAELSGRDDRSCPDVGLMDASSLGDTQLILKWSEFFAQVNFVMILDPSSMLATHQVGLSILVEHLSRGQQVTYCAFDGNSDGLVDSLSHALRTNLTEVKATEFSSAATVSMMWEADGEFLQHRLFSGIAHYLGVGSELGLVALKNQVSKVSWASRKAIPLADMRWILGQYYGEIFEFAELPQEQHQLDKHFDFLTDPRFMGKRENCFVMAEDEECNMFEVSRQFATRGTGQAFVNVISPNYLLRDYMVGNADMMAKDPKAIPAFAPDFSRGQRNLIFSIVMMMVQGNRSLSEEELTERLRFAGALDGMRSVQEALEGMILEHFDFTGDVDMTASEVAIREVAEYSPTQRQIITRRYYEMNDAALYSESFKSLRNVPLVTEEANGSHLLLGSRLYGHIYQMLLPGQFINIQGKYYEAMTISEDTGVLLRRAADHFTRRRYYRQLRSYTITDWGQGDQVGDVRTIRNIHITRGTASICVDTFGYLDMADYGDLSSAQRVQMQSVPQRRYSNKELLRIDLEGADPKVVSTLTILMSELMRTLFPNDYQYLAVVSPVCNQLPDGVVYGCQCDDAPNAIFVVEDSLIDIGLVSSVERNMKRILEMCWDYLDWHGEMLQGTASEQMVYELGELPKVPDNLKDEKKRGFFARFFGKLKKDKKKIDSEPAKTDEPEAKAIDPEAKAIDPEPELEPEDCDPISAPAEESPAVSGENEQDASDELPSFDEPVTNDEGDDNGRV